MKYLLNGAGIFLVSWLWITMQITSTNDLNILGISITSGGDTTLTSTTGNINIASQSSVTWWNNSTWNLYNSRSVNSVITTNTNPTNTSNLIQKNNNDQQIQTLNSQLAAAIYHEQTNQINNLQKQISDLKQQNTQLINSISNSTTPATGNLFINAAKNVNIIAGQDITKQYYHYSYSDLFSSSETIKDTETQMTKSELLTGNNININGNAGVNILASIIAGSGNGSITSSNGNVNVLALQNSYYDYNYHKETHMDVGAFFAAIVVGALVGLVTAGIGTALVAGVEALSTGVMVAGIMGSVVSEALSGLVVGALGAATGSLIGGTEAIQSGDANSTTTQVETNINSNLVFNSGNLNIAGSNGTNTDGGNIQSNNLTHSLADSSTGSYTSVHTAITPDWNSLLENAAINGAVAGATVPMTKGILSLAENGIFGTPGKTFFNVDSFVKTYTNIGSIEHPIYLGFPFISRTGLEQAVPDPNASNQSTGSNNISFNN